MTSVRENIIETAALGRPFQLGMLYDCRNDTIVPGMTLWDREQLQQNEDINTQNNTEFTVTTSDTIDEKAKHLKVDGELKLSLLGGNVSVNGAARYFNDTKKSFIQERLTLQYRTSTKFVQLNMNHLAQGKIYHHEVFDHDVATHVVTAVLYGADAYFVFDREENLSEDTTNLKVEGNIDLEKLKNFISAAARAELNMKENEKAALKQLPCTFYGDFKLWSNPATFEEAMKVYTDLPKMLGEKGEHAVPVRVWLYPLVKLNSKAAKLERNISTDIIRSVESVIEALNVTNMKCGDLLQDTVAKSFSTFYDQVQEFQKFCSDYKKDFMKKLGSLLPEIRGGKTDISAISDLLQAHEKSPFNTRDLHKWITVREKKSKQIKTLLKQLFELGAEICDDIDEYLLDLNVEKLVVYAFNCHQHEDLLLTKQEIYLNPSTMKNNNENTTDQNFQEKPWTSDELMKMKNNLKLFKDLITFNKMSESTKFIVQSLPQKSNFPSSCILVYENGVSEAICFSPPLKPECPKIQSVTENSVTVKLSPSCSDTLQRKLLYKIKEEKDWKSQLVHQDVVTLTDLKAGTDYEIKCGAVGKLNYSVESETYTVTTTLSVIKPLKIPKSTENEAFPRLLDSSMFSRNKDNPMSEEIQNSTRTRRTNSLEGYRPTMSEEIQNSARTRQTNSLEGYRPTMSEEVQNSVRTMQTNNLEGYRPTKIETLKCIIIRTGKTLDSDIALMDLLKNKIPANLQEVKTVDECDIILVFCPVIRGLEIDFKAAVKELNQYSDTKRAVVVVLHHTFDKDLVVPDIRDVKRENMIVVHYLFYECEGLLKCQRNDESLDRIINYIQPQICRKNKSLEGTNSDQSSRLEQCNPASATQNVHSASSSSVYHQIKDASAQAGNKHRTHDMRRTTADSSSGSWTTKLVEQIKKLKKSQTVKYFSFKIGNTQNTNKKFISQLEHQIKDLEKVSTVDECDFILVFCPIVSRAGTDIQSAIQKLNDQSVDKPAFLVLLHHTFNPECVVSDSSRSVIRNNMTTVDCLFHEDYGLLRCPKNHSAFTTIIQSIQSQFYTKLTTEENMDIDQTHKQSQTQKTHKYFAYQRECTPRTRIAFMNNHQPTAYLQEVEAENKCDIIVTFVSPE